MFGAHSKTLGRRPSASFNSCVSCSSMPFGNPKALYMGLWAGILSLGATFKALRDGTGCTCERQCELRDMEEEAPPTPVNTECPLTGTELLTVALMSSILHGIWNQSSDIIVYQHSCNPEHIELRTAVLRTILCWLGALSRRASNRYPN